MNATIVGGLIGGILVFMSSLLVPIISKRMNKASDAAENAERSATSAEKLSISALNIVERLEKDCRRCEVRLGAAKGALESLIQVNQRIIPLLPAEHAVTAELVEGLRAARRTLWDWNLT